MRVETSCMLVCASVYSCVKFKTLIAYTRTYTQTHIGLHMHNAHALTETHIRTKKRTCTNAHTRMNAHKCTKTHASTNSYTHIRTIHENTKA